MPDTSEDQLAVVPESGGKYIYIYIRKCLYVHAHPSRQVDIVTHRIKDTFYTFMGCSVRF